MRIWVSSASWAQSVMHETLLSPLCWLSAVFPAPAITKQSVWQIVLSLINSQCVCERVCVCVCMRGVCVFVCVCMCESVCVCVCVWVYTCGVCVCVWVNVVCACVCVCLWACLWRYNCNWQYICGVAISVDSHWISMFKLSHCGVICHGVCVQVPVWVCVQVACFSFQTTTYLLGS